VKMGVLLLVVSLLLFSCACLCFSLASKKTKYTVEIYAANGDQLYLIYVDKPQHIKGPATEIIIKEIEE